MFITINDGIKIYTKKITKKFNDQFCSLPIKLCTYKYQQFGFTNYQYCDYDIESSGDKRNPYAIFISDFSNNKDDHIIGTYIDSFRWKINIDTQSQKGLFKLISNYVYTTI